MSEADSTLVVGTYASAGTALGLVAAIVICAAYCHTDNRVGKPFWFAKTLTIYNIGMAAFFVTQASFFYNFLSAQAAFSGVGVATNESMRRWLYIHAGAQVTHLLDVGYMIARGGNERVSYAACFHVTTIYGIWGLCLDNRDAVFAHGSVVFIAMMMSLQAAAVYAYRIPSTWGKCVTPGAQISTGFQITLFAILALHGGYALYYSVDDGSVARGICDGLWLVYFIVMTVLVMSLMFKQRSNRCCSAATATSQPSADPV